MNHSNYVLLLALTLSELVVASGAPLRASSSDWDILQTLKPGQDVRVELKDAKLLDGAFQALSGEGMIIRQSAGEQTFGRDDILRVYSRRKNHRVRNLAIGAGIGVALAALAVSANHWGENTGIRSTGWIWPVGVGFFGGIGAAIPTGGWHEIYHARHRRKQ